MGFSIIKAEKSHAPYIGKAIIMAIGKELVENLAGKHHTAKDVLNLFTILASREDSQYSYNKAVIAVDNEQNVLGVAVIYDGSDLRRLRAAFFEEAENIIGLTLNGPIIDETDADEVYLDTIAVFPEYRGRGIGRKLITEAYLKANEKEKPLGLLVSKNNPKAMRLYESVGFKTMGERPFAGEMMYHMRKE